MDRLCKRKNPDTTGIAVVYCNYANKTEQTAVNLLASIVRQLEPPKGSVCKDLEDLYQHHHTLGTRPSIVDIASILRMQISAYENTYIIVDGLDESYQEGGNGEIFLDEVMKLLPDIHLLITSRPIPSLDFDLRDAAKIEISAKEADIRKYLDSRINTNRRISSFVRKYPTLKAEITEEVVKKAQGM